MPAARKRLCNERFRQAVRGMPPKEVKFEHARGEKTSVQRTFSPNRAGEPTNEVTFAHARGEKIAVKRHLSWHIARIALRKPKSVVLSPRITFKTRRLFAKSREEMAKSPPLFCETREVSFGGREVLCRALRLFCLSFACWVRELGDVGKVRRRCLFSLAVVRRPLVCADFGLRSAQKKSAHVLCVCRLSFG